MDKTSQDGKDKNKTVKLYSYIESGNVYKVSLLLALLNVPYETEELDFMGTQEHHQPAYLALNPKGQIPTLTHGEDVITESGAILVYVAGTFQDEQNDRPPVHPPGLKGAWWPSTPLEQARVMEWLSFSASSVAVSFSKARFILNFDGPGGPEVLATAQAKGFEVLQHLERHLSSGRDWLELGRPTLADIAVFPYIAMAPMAGQSLEPYAQVRAWIQRVKDLPGFVGMPGLEDPYYRMKK